MSDEVKRLKLEKVQWEKERTDLLAQRENLEKELQEIQQEKDEIVQQNHDLQTHLRAKEYQVNWKQVLLQLNNYWLSISRKSHVIGSFLVMRLK